MVYQHTHLKDYIEVVLTIKLFTLFVNIDRFVLNVDKVCAQLGAIGSTGRSLSE